MASGGQRVGLGQIKQPKISFAKNLYSRQVQLRVIASMKAVWNKGDTVGLHKSASHKKLNLPSKNPSVFQPKSFEIMKVKQKKVEQKKSEKYEFI